MNFFQLVMTIAAFVVITTDISARETATKSLDLSTLSPEVSPEVDFYRNVNLRFAAANEDKIENVPL